MNECQEARNSDFYKKHNCGPDDGSSDPLAGGFGGFGFCNGSSNCFNMGALTQGLGLARLGSLLGEMNAEAKRLHELQGKRLQTAQTTLGAWQKNLGTPESQRSGDITGLNHDRNLVSNATDAYNGKGKFEAQPGKHPLIDAALNQFADAREGESLIQKEMEKVRNGMQALEQMKTATNGRNDNLGALTDQSGGKTIADNGQKGSSDGKGDDSGTSDITGKGSLKLAGGKAGGINSGLSGKSEAGVGADGSSPGGAGKDDEAASLKARLRATLDARNKQAQKNADAIENGEFQTNLGNVVDVESREKGSRQNALDDFISDASQKAGGKGDAAVAEKSGAAAGGFSLAGSETDREVRRLTGGREIASSRADGVLGQESSDLFQRVHQAHKHCLTRECVAMVGGKR